MKIWRQITVLLLFFLVLTSISACNASGGDKATAQQSVEVIKGDLAVLVNGTGNSEASREVKLSFGSNGKVKNIYVEEGDAVVKDDVLAELDKDALELAKTEAEVGLTQAEVTLTQANLALTQAQLAQRTTEYNLKNTLDSETTLELALLNAQIALRDAEHHLDETQDIYTWPDIETAQKDVDNAEAFLQYALQRNLSDETIEYAQSRLDAAEAVLDAKRNAYDTEEVAIARLQLEAARMAEAQAQKDVDELAEDIELQELSLASATEAVKQTQESIELAKQSVQLARQSLDQAQKNLDEATIIAPFDGSVASINASEGDTVTTAITIVHLVDPTSMALIIEVDEVDIPGVRLNQEAVISIDALPDTIFLGNVTSVYPVPNTVSGIVMYNVKINFNVSEDSDVKVGMSASADIIIDKRSDVLLLPNEAIKENSQGEHVVKVMIDKQLQERQVVTGLSDGSETEIISGLGEGEIVIR